MFKGVPITGHSLVKIASDRKLGAFAPTCAVQCTAGVSDKHLAVANRKASACLYRHVGIRWAAPVMPIVFTAASHVLEVETLRTIGGAHKDLLAPQTFDAAPVHHLCCVLAMQFDEARHLGKLFLMKCWVPVRVDATRT